MAVMTNQRKRQRTKMADRGGGDLPQRSACPLVSSLDLFGDRWTLILIRDLLAGKRRYGEFLASPEGIPSNILADRLRLLERHGVVRKAPYQQRPVRYAYELTDRGADLIPVLQAIANWGNAHIPGCWRQPDWFVALTPEALKKARQTPSES
jgi:DNA-binding HxlR family transcriptional regulator